MLCNCSMFALDCYELHVIFDSTTYYAQETCFSLSVWTITFDLIFLKNITKLHIFLVNGESIKRIDKKICGLSIDWGEWSNFGESSDCLPTFSRIASVYFRSMRKLFHIKAPMEKAHFPGLSYMIVQPFFPCIST